MTVRLKQLRPLAVTCCVMAVCVYGYLDSTHSLQQVLWCITGALAVLAILVSADSLTADLHEWEYVPKCRWLKDLRTSQSVLVWTAGFGNDVEKTSLHYQDRLLESAAIMLVQFNHDGFSRTETVSAILDEL